MNTTKMTLTALIAAGSLYLTPASAHTNHNQFSLDSCNVEFHGDLTLDDNTLSITNKQNQTLTYSGHVLSIDNQAVQLSNAQQVKMDNYAQQVRAQVPQVVDIALEGVEIAGVAITEVGEAFGIDSMEQLQSKLVDLSAQIRNHFYENGSFVMSDKRIDTLEQDLEGYFDESFEQAIEEAMVQSMGSIFMAIGSQMLGSGGDMNEFEQRMENMGEQIEQKVELRAEALEQKADKLCHSFEQLAQQEQALAEEIPEFKAFTMLQQQHQ